MKKNNTFLLVIALLFGVFGTVAAQLPVPYMVKDINTAMQSSNPSNLIEYNGKLYFTATDGINGIKLWESDGTINGTYQIPGLDTLLPGLPHTFITALNSLFFISGGQLWMSDGTVSNTRMIKDVNQTLRSCDSKPLVLNNKLYFSGTDLAHGSELWVTDGTDNGTYMLRDIYSGTGSSNITDLIVFNNQLLFSAQNEVTGEEPWISDGTTNGTRLLLNIRPNISSSVPRQFTVLNNKAFFVANDGIHGEELWETDGHALGTRLHDDIRQGSASASPQSLQAVGNYLYFTAEDGYNLRDLWVTTGARSGAEFIELTPSFGPPLEIYQFVEMNGKCYFILYFPNFSGDPRSLLTSNGTKSGTYSISLVDNVGSNLHSFGNFMLFDNDRGLGKELWYSEGTSNRTFPLADINPGYSSSNPANFTKVGNSIFFTATDGTHGNELWAMDATALSVEKVKDINPNFQIFPNPSTDQFTIQLDDFDATKTNRLRIFNLQGQLIKEMPLSNPITQIEVKDLPAGIYFVQLNEGATRKLVKN